MTSGIVGVLIWPAHLVLGQFTTGTASIPPIFGVLRLWLPLISLAGLVGLFGGLLCSIRLIRRAHRLDGMMCHSCLFDLRGVPEGQCPECGEAFTHASLRTAWEIDHAVRPGYLSVGERVAGSLSNWSIGPHEMGRVVHPAKLLAPKRRHPFRLTLLLAVGVANYVALGALFAGSEPALRVGLLVLLITIPLTGGYFALGLAQCVRWQRRGRRLGGLMCTACGEDLRGVPEGSCPACGKRWTRDFVRRAWGLEGETGEAPGDEASTAPSGLGALRWNLRLVIRALDRARRRQGVVAPKRCSPIRPAVLLCVGAFIGSAIIFTFFDAEHALRRAQLLIAVVYPATLCYVALAFGMCAQWQRSARRTHGLLCPHCGYDLRGVPEGACPECGKGFTYESLRRAWGVEEAEGGDEAWGAGGEPPRSVSSVAVAGLRQLRVVWRCRERVCAELPRGTLWRVAMSTAIVVVPTALLVAPGFRAWAGLSYGSPDRTGWYWFGIVMIALYVCIIVVLLRFIVASLSLIRRTARRLCACACPNCGYDLRGLPEGACPECGKVFTHASLRAEWRIKQFAGADETPSGGG